MAEDGYSFGGTGGTGTSVQDPAESIGVGTKLRKLGAVLSAGSAGTWDAGFGGNGVLESPIVFRDPKTGRLTMIYHGYGTATGATRAAIGLAYSDDGLVWSKYASNPILQYTNTGGDPDQNGCAGGTVFYENGTYYLYYIGLTGTGYEGGTKSICLATAPAMTGPWTRQGAKIVAAGSGWRAGAVWHPNVVKRGSTYYLFFNASDVSINNEKIGYATATSPDGPWTVDDVNSPILTYGDSWESNHIGDPYVRRVGDTWVMDYYAGTAPGLDGIAFCPDSAFPVGPWTKYAGNPVLTAGATGAFDAAHAHKPSIIFVNGSLHHYYTAADAAGARTIALAVHQPLNTVTAAATAVSGSRSDGTALASLLTALAAKGIIADASTAATVLAADAFTNRSGTLLGTTSTHGETVLGWGDTADWSITASQAKFVGASDGAIGYAMSPATTDNYTISVTLAAAAGSFPVALAPVFNTASLGVTLFYQSSSSGWKIKVDGAVSGQLVNDSHVPTAGDTYTVTKSGTTYTLKRTTGGVTTTLGSFTGITPATVTGNVGYIGNGGNQPLQVSAFSATTP